MLTLTEYSLVPMDQGTFMWVDIKVFAIDPSASTDGLLSDLMASPAYRHDYCSPFDPDDMDYPGPGLHANWWVDRLAPAMFAPIAAADAVETVKAWAEDQEWAGGYAGPSEQTRERLRRGVLSLFRDGEVLMLQPPDRDAFHDYGGIVGLGGYHEFVVIDRALGLLRLVVAADD